MLFVTTEACDPCRCKTQHLPRHGILSPHLLSRMLNVVREVISKHIRAVGSLKGWNQSSVETMRHRGHDRENMRRLSSRPGTSRFHAPYAKEIPYSHTKSYIRSVKRCTYPKVWPTALAMDIFLRVWWRASPRCPLIVSTDNIFVDI